MKHYVKVLTLGDPLITNLLNGKVVIQEKVDGSQFRIYKDSEGMLHFGSHRIDYENIPIDKMFNKAVDCAKAQLINCPNNITIFAEYLQSVRHNTLKYGRVPINHLVVFDVFYENKWMSTDELQWFCNEYGFDCVPVLFEGNGKDVTPELMDTLIQKVSFLGETIIEGIVIKNYEKVHLIEYLLGMPLMGKYVRAEFKEKNMEVWKEIKKSPVDKIRECYANENRWLKSFNRLKEEGRITYSLKDLAFIIPEIMNDIEIEEKEEIKKTLYDGFIREMKSGWTRGVPEWYKKLLLDKQLNGAEK